MHPLSSALPAVVCLVPPGRLFFPSCLVARLTDDSTFVIDGFEGHIFSAVAVVPTSSKIRRFTINSLGCGRLYWAEREEPEGAGAVAAPVSLAWSLCRRAQRHGGGNPANRAIALSVPDHMPNTWSIMYTWHGCWGSSTRLVWASQPMSSVDPVSQSAGCRAPRQCMGARRPGHSPAA